MKQTSTPQFDWFQSIAEEAIAAPCVPADLTLSVQQGVCDLLDALALMEGFGLPEPDLEPIVHFDMRL